MPLTHIGSQEFLAVMIDNSAINTFTYPLQLALFTQAASGSGIVPDDNPSSGAAGTDTQEVNTGSGYARQSITWGTPTAASPSVLSESGGLTWTQATGTWSSTNGNDWIGAWCIYDSSATPDPVWVGAFNTAKQVLNLDTVSIASGDLTLQLD